MSPQHFQWRVDGKVGVVTLNRPEKKNPLTFESYAELRDFFFSLKNEKQIKTIVVTGAVGNFFSGGDVHEIIGPLTKMAPPQLLEFTRMTGDLVKAMRHCPQPLIAAVEGVCAGAGAIIAMACDLRYAAPSAKTAFLFVRVGLAGCDMGACTMLPRIIGQGRASDLLYTGRSMGAEEGLAWGFFNRVGDRVLDLSIETARELAAGPALAHAMTKKMLHQEWNVGVDEAIEMEAQAQAGLMQTRDFQRAYQAFAAKQKPVFEGD